MPVGQHLSAISPVPTTREYNSPPPTHTFIADVALDLVEVCVLLFHQSRITPSSNVRQRRVDLLYVVVHRNNRLGRPNEVAIPCPRFELTVNSIKKGQRGISHTQPERGASPYYWRCRGGAPVRPGAR